MKRRWVILLLLCSAACSGEAAAQGAFYIASALVAAGVNAVTQPKNSSACFSKCPPRTTYCNVHTGLCEEKGSPTGEAVDLRAAAPPDPPKRTWFTVHPQAPPTPSHLGHTIASPAAAAGDDAPNEW